MSNFIVDEKKLNESRPQYMDGDLLRGLRAAIQHNQMVLAMQYVEIMLTEIDDKLVSEKTDAVKATSAKTPAKTTVSSKATKSKTETPVEADAD